ncbi:hypothetical protein L3i20_v231460 [Paenibacillus sp. L3-i20]|nr:hypothetical protein L3i20_v231460 [Paenibacillus sp. L3-i20]
MFNYRSPLNMTFFSNRKAVTEVLLQTRLEITIPAHPHPIHPRKQYRHNKISDYLIDYSLTMSPNKFANI